VTSFTANLRVATNDQAFHAASRLIQAIESDTGWKPRPQLRAVYPADQGEVLSVVEDLWLRLVRHPAIHSAVLRDAATGEYLVLFRIADETTGRKDWQLAEARDLLDTAAHPENYAWSQDGTRGNLTSGIRWIGDTLVIELTRLEPMQRWPEGDTLVGSVQTLLHRFQNRGGAHAH
jgi:hypothetical protein